ncbi:MAG TPA: glutamate synthase large subunit [Tepidisphaeraceae bacterium]|jgi:glutamate synthase (NADPH/NADH) large chain/glutamate synthase (ferredoxin)
MKHEHSHGMPPAQGLYDPQFERDACGVGFIAHVKGKPSHKLVANALEILENMEHRGAVGSEPDSGDGCGILTGTPDKFFRRECGKLGFKLPKAGDYAVAMCFLPKDLVSRQVCEAKLEEMVEEYGMTLLGWRDVPVNSDVLGPTPRATEPRIRQAFIGMGENFYNRADFNRRLYLVRQRAENDIEFGNAVPPAAQDEFYICLTSTNRMVYKGMLMPLQVRAYFPDLSDPAFESQYAIVHSRFSTNTFPSWRLAHPYRYLAHNGEINTLRGNRNWMKSRAGSLHSDVFGDELNKLFPILTQNGSDSATLDNALQFLSVNGRSVEHAMMMLVPEAWQNNPLMDPDLKAFYEYHACLMEPWDGPANIAFTNGDKIGAILDRNGLRPSRYFVTKDDHVIMASEAGTLPIEAKNIARKWRLQPGKIFLIDFKKKRIIDDSEVKSGLVDSRPWKRWLDENLTELESLPDAPVPAPHPEPHMGVRDGGQPNGTDAPDTSLLNLQHAFGYTNEDLRLLMTPMAATGAEAVGSMGTDTPLACLSDKPQLLFSYFKQLFAQVTNPPLDAIREELVTSLYTYLGREGNLLTEEPGHCRLIKLKSPILTNAEFAKLAALDGDDHKAIKLSLVFDVSEGEAGLVAALKRLCEQAVEAVRAGRASILILSDRGVDREHGAIPSLLATSAVHHTLIKAGVRAQCGLVIETAEAREVHHFCLLVGYGAGAVNPYLALESIADLHADGLLPDMSVDKAQKNYIKAANKGILKVASKMGISTVQSYRGAQIFEAVGLAKELIEEHFVGTPSRIQGVDLDVIAAETLMRHRRAYPPIVVETDMLDVGGQYQYRRHGEYHQWNPDTVAKLQYSVRVDSFKTYLEYAKAINDEAKHRCTLRGMLKFKPAKNPIPIEDVEPAKEIVKRFVTGAMSFGSISRESHETLAIAMNTIGGKSNTGEGGEDPERFADKRRSAIKQIASGRFGVTTEYLVNADELQIKMAQGAKPGEGGALTGNKVDDYVGKIRHSTPGVGLISPPPHHDIYSIEDLAQLIHDLKNVNPQSRISVKLVSEVGVGTIAAGVAKAKADHILISGDGGGTGNAPQSSIKHTGLPWELGLAETQQVLILNGLRGRVTVQADGQMKTGRDAIVAALLGAEEVGFSTAPLIAAGCIMMRVCHLNTCPVGIATQDPELRKKFNGKPEHVINYMFFVAEECRQIMAQMGFRTWEEMVGRADCLDFEDVSDHWKAKLIDLSPLLHMPEPKKGDARIKNCDQDHGLAVALDQNLLKLAAPAIDNGTKVREESPLRNINRTVGTMLSGVIAKKYGMAGLPDDTIHFKFNGSAGQSFGAFLMKGVTLEVEGEANDYVGKGLCGGRIVVYPPKDVTFKPEENIIAGNTIGYGGICGEIFLRGVAGERFCVRNSGANAVVEGVGDHGCEYMTGGRVVILGPTGRNFAAGMSGGIAYVYDDLGALPKLCNMEMVELETLSEPEDLQTLRELLEKHHAYTGSTRAKSILDDFEKEVRWFVKVMPTDYRRVLEQRKAKQLAGQA